MSKTIPHYRRTKTAVNLSGKAFGRWTVLHYAGDRKWLCRCKCGIEKSIHTSSLTIGESSSCGCLRLALIKQRKTTHGFGNTKNQIYACWVNMRQRCLNKKVEAYSNYGGRGIKVCERWLNSFEDFISDMGMPPTPKHQIERRNNDGNYEPSNCYWATRKEQGNNRRTNVWIEKDGIRLTVSQWERSLGFTRGVIKSRLRIGWSKLEAITPNLVRPHGLRGVQKR